MPQGLRKSLQALADRMGREISWFDAPGLWPGPARGRFAQHIDAPWAVFIDNDVLAQPGWLQALLDCARTTNAGIVGPLYLWGRDERAPTIHMAGGELIEEQAGDRVVMVERHRMINAPLQQAAGLKREPCGYAEFHCMLMRRDVYRLPDVFSAEIVSVHEHIHASLVARQHGFGTLPKESKHGYGCFMLMKRLPGDDASPKNGSKTLKSMTGGGQPLFVSHNSPAVNSGKWGTADGMWKMMPLIHFPLTGLSITALNMNPRPLRTLS